jgi:hypothetical protein
MPDQPLYYSVKEGECIASVAFEHGFHPDTIWNLPENADLVARRTTGYVLEPGDILYIPATRVRQEERAIDRHHKFKRNAVPEKLHLQFLEDDEPCEGAEFQLEIDFRPVASGVLDKEGKLEAWIPPNARHGRLLLDNDQEVLLELGCLNPRDDEQGLHDRLYNLGYFDGMAHDRKLEDAVMAFQDNAKEEMTGAAAAELREKLEQQHGS